MSLWLCPVVVPAQSGASPESIQQWNDISAKNALVGEAKPPFHLRIDFSLYDLQGRSGQKGTIEEWWTFDKGYRAEINSPLEHVVYPGDDELQSDEARRENYLALEMLSSFEHPMAHLRLDQPRNIFTEGRKDGQVKLVCYQAGPVTSPAPNPVGSFVCLNPLTNSVRQVPQAGETVARNSIGTFHDTLVALDIRVAYNDLPAIEGHLSLLRDFDPSRATVALKNPNDSSASIEGNKAEINSVPASGSGSSQERVKVSASVMSGRLTKVVRADYPQTAREHRLLGSVLLHVTVSPEGAVESVFPIASPSPLLTGPAEEAIKQWVYKPWELNGKPVTADTTVSLTFHH